MLASGTTVFVLAPGFAVVYAPLMVALGTLARIEPGRVASLILRTSLLLLLLLYSIYCDPLWSLIGGIGWSAAFAVVALSPLRRKPILVRCVALACCVVVLAASGVLEYLYTLPRYTARVQFSSLLNAAGQCHLWFDPVHVGLCQIRVRRLHPGVDVRTGRGQRPTSRSGHCRGGKLRLSARLRDGVCGAPAGLVAAAAHLCRAVHLAVVRDGGVAGYWGALRHLGLFARHLAARGDPGRRLGLAGRWPWVPAVAALAAVAVVPAAGILAAHRNRQLATAWVLPWPNETELVEFLSSQIGLRVGEPFRGSAMFSVDGLFRHTLDSILCQHGIPTANEYSQLITPQIFYLPSPLQEGRQRRPQPFHAVDRQPR